MNRHTEKTFSTYCAAVKELAKSVTAAKLWKYTAKMVHTVHGM